MNHHVREQDNCVQFIELTPERLRRLARAAQTLIDLLDDLAGDPDLEDGGDDEETADDEPSLGAPERHVPRKGQEAWADGRASDQWDVDLEIDGDEDEPSLGSVERHPNPYPCLGDRFDSQAHWASGANDDREDEHDGREPHEDDEPGADEEECLGATTCMNQDHAWQNHYTGWFALNGEPDLGWTEERSGAGHPEMALRGYDGDREEGADDVACDDNELDGHGYDDVEPLGDLPGGNRNRGRYRPSVKVIGDCDLDAGPLGYMGPDRR